MDTRGTRRELAASVRLLGRDELWLFTGLAGGAVGYLIWLAGTGVAVEQFGRVVADSLSVDQRSVEVATLALLWVVLPSLAAVRYVVGHITNIRGNVEQCYRFDRPLLLLGPPLALVLAVAAAVVEGTVGPAVLIALGAANIVLLVRTVAYGYRVYSFSTPRLLQGLLFLGAVGISLGVIRQTASLTGQAGLVDAMARQYGLSGTLELGWLTAPLLPLLGALTPGVLALAYVWVQLFASLIVRIGRPDVPRSEIRAGQRYPQVVQPGTSRRLAMGTVPRKSDSDAENASDSKSTAGAISGSGSQSSASGSTASGSKLDAAGTDGGQTAGMRDDAATGDGRDDSRFGQTRVYTPPDEADDDATGDDAGSDIADNVKSELCPICGATYAADADPTHCPNCNAVLDEE